MHSFVVLSLAIMSLVVARLLTDVCAVGSGVEPLNEFVCPGAVTVR